MLNLYILLEFVYRPSTELAVVGDVFDGVFLCCPFFSRDVLDEISD